MGIYAPGWKGVPEGEGRFLLPVRRRRVHAAAGQRIYNLLDELREESEEKTYILVAHNGISRVVHSYFYEMTNEEYAAFGVENCAVLRYDFEDAHA